MYREAAAAAGKISKMGVKSRHPDLEPKGRGRSQTVTKADRPPFIGYRWLPPPPPPRPPPSVRPFRRGRGQKGRKENLDFLSPLRKGERSVVKCTGGKDKLEKELAKRKIGKWCTVLLASSSPLDSQERPPPPFIHIIFLLGFEFL